MQTPSPGPHGSRAITSAFVVLLFTPLVVHAVTPDSNVSILEKRSLAEPPRMTSVVSDWPGFPARVNAWIDDHFGLRAELIRLGAAMRERLSPESSTFGVRGDDGWLFNNIDNSLAMFQGLYPFDLGEADAWLDGVEHLRDAASAAGSALVLIVPPNKHTIYAGRLSKPRVPGETRLEELTRRAAERGSPFVDVRTALAARADHEKLYFKTDTHWTTTGAFVAADALVRGLRERGVRVDPVDETRLERSRVDDYAGDIYGLLGIANGTPEPVEEITIADAGRELRREGVAQLDWRNFAGYRVQMEPRGKPSLLLIGDSYAHAMVPYLTEVFDVVAFTHNRIGRIPVDMVGSGDFDVVVLEFVERLLSYPLRPEPAPRSSTEPSTRSSSAEVR